MLSKEELEEYCKKYYADVYRYCLHCLSNKEDAEDATQDTFVVFSKKGHLIEEIHVKPWLLRTAHHMVLKAYKKRYTKTNKECVYDEALLEASRRFRSFEEDIVSYYGERYEKEVYERLSERDKELFELYGDGFLKTGAISQLLGLDPHACSMGKKRLIERCRDIMKEILFY